MEFKKLADFLWPLGATLLALFVVPMLIEQYPEVFKENRWPLPIISVIVLLCWIVPFFVHDRAKRIFGWVSSFGWPGRSLGVIALLMILVILLYGSYRIFRFHTNHLNSAVKKRENTDSGKEVAKTPSPEPQPTPTAPPKKENNQESPAFAVDIEHRIFTLPGPNGTSFWFGSFGLSSCSVEPTGTAIFVRITNRQKHKEMITAYSIKGLRKIQVSRGRMFVILPKGKIGNGFVPKVIDFGAPKGMGMLVGFPVDDADTSKAIPVTGDFLDYKVGEGHYLEPDEPVRGWVFFEYRKGYPSIPGHLTIKITDQFQHSFNYLIPDHIGDPEGDILPRRIVQGPLEDLSRCTVVK